MRVSAALVYLLFVAAALSAEEIRPELCLYRNESGAYVQVRSRSAVPELFKESARCFAARPDEQSRPAASERRAVPADAVRSDYVRPSDISLDGNLRNSTMNSALGPITLRWPRAAETLFGRTPERAMADAARTASRALKSLSFPPTVQALRLEWDVVFIEKDPPPSQVPSRVLSSCHPAWMIPPSNIYVVAERVAASCGGGARREATVADGDLARTLLHEMGHAIEFQILSNHSPNDAPRGEGFASWFEAYASGFSSLIPHGEVRATQLTLMHRALKNGISLSNFNYSPEAYGLAAAHFHLLFEKKGIDGILAMYKAVNGRRADLLSAASETLGWSEKRLLRELSALR